MKRPGGFGSENDALADSQPAKKTRAYETVCYRPEEARPIVRFTPGRHGVGEGQGGFRLGMGGAVPAFASA